MAESIKFLEGYVHCTCHNPVWKYLEDTLFTEEVIKQFRESMGEKISASEPVSIMYTGGTIRPVKDGKMDTVEAIGFHDGRVVAMGSKSEVLARMNGLGVKYAQVALRDGHTLLPGFIEPHVHIVPTAMMMGWNDFGPFDEQDLQKTYDTTWLNGEIQRAKGELTHKGYWILAHSVDPSLMPFHCGQQGGLNTLQSFSCDSLDEMEKDVPLLMISASGHTAYVNTPALRSIYDSSLKIQEEYKTFEEYRAHVNSNGGLQEMEEMIPAILAVPKLQLGTTIISGLKGSFDSLFQTANKRGVTLMYDAAMSSILKLVLEIYLFFEIARVRIGYAELCESAGAAKEFPPYEPVTELKKVYQGSVKVVSDGSNQGLTGYQNERYRCYPDNNIGFFNFPSHSQPPEVTEEYRSMVTTIAEKGWPLMIHANGNRAIDFTIEVYRDFLGGNAGAGLEKRHRIEHCSLLSEENLQKMSDLGISPSFLIGHVGYWGYVFKNAIFEEKAEQLDLCKSALDKGMRITLHSDNSVTPLGPLRMMEQAITRIMEQDPTGNVLNECEKISAEQALKAITYDAAWQCHADQWVGSLEEGKMADYVILEEDPITRNKPEGMRNIPVLETWVGGIKMHPV